MIRKKEVINKNKPKTLCVLSSSMKKRILENLSAKLELFFFFLGRSLFSFTTSSSSFFSLLAIEILYFIMVLKLDLPETVISIDI